MNEKINESLDILDRVLKHKRYPFLLWSGGKDSMALLHMLFVEHGTRCPVVQFREPWQPWKYEFQHRMIEKYGLEVHTWGPTESAFQQTDDEFEVQNLYYINNTPFTCPSGITPIEDGKPFVCSVDMYHRPKQQGIHSNWDLAVVGHKACDSDPIYGGDAGTRVEMLNNGDMMSTVYPLRNWTHDDVFQYCEDNDIPIQQDRYEKVDGKWRERDNRDTNCDYVHACTRCVDRRSGKFVNCPKYLMRIENISDKVRWANQDIPKYMED